MKLTFNIIVLFAVGVFTSSAHLLAQSASAVLREDKSIQAQISVDIRSLEAEIQKNNDIESLKLAAKKQEDRSTDDQLLRETNLLNPQKVNAVLIPTSILVKPVKVPAKTERRPHAS